MNIKKYWKKNVKIEHGEFAMCPTVVCADGFTMSVQASRYHYCAPRVTDLSAPYSSWEIGFPNKKEPLLREWCEDWRRPKKSVYAGVPTKVVNAVIKKHGGIKQATHA